MRAIPCRSLPDPCLSFTTIYNSSSYWLLVSQSQTIKHGLKKSSSLEFQQPVSINYQMHIHFATFYAQCWPKLFLFCYFFYVRYVLGHHVDCRALTRAHILFYACEGLIICMHGLHMGVVQTQNITEMNCGGYPAYEVKFREGVLFKYTYNLHF